MTNKTSLQRVEKLIEKHQDLLPEFFLNVFRESIKGLKPLDIEIDRMIEVLNDEVRKIKRLKK
jgi:hypothetical protein